MENKTQTSASPKGPWSIVRREPLVLFVVLGALLYGAWMALAARGEKTVRIEASALRVRETAQEELLGRPLTDEEREILREDYIDEEVLIREALERGLQWSDYRVRRRLVRIMRGSLAERVPDPSVAQLQAYFRDNIDQYTSGESVTVEQVYFPWEKEIAGEEIQKALEALRAGEDPELFGFTGPRLSRRMVRATRSTLIQTYGLGPGFADVVEGLPEGEWHGPVESLGGVHLVRVVERHPPETANFDDIERYLRQEWTFSREREIQQERIVEIRERYRIEMVEE